MVCNRRSDVRSFSLNPDKRRKATIVSKCLTRSVVWYVFVCWYKSRLYFIAVFLIWIDTPNVTDSEDLHSESSDLEFDYSSDEYPGFSPAVFPTENPGKLTISTCTHVPVLFNGFIIIIKWTIIWDKCTVDGMAGQGNWTKL